VQFNDADAHAAVLYDMNLYKKFGGSSLVENTSHGLQRNLLFTKEVSQKSGVHLIAGTGNGLTEIYVFFK
jgi:phosphotriesterase-related protein